MSFRQLLGNTKSQARAAVQATLRRADGWSERAWELRKYWFPATISAGEMTAILGRMGLSSFHEYTAAQMLGHFGPRTFIPSDRQAVVDLLRRNFAHEATATVDIANQIAAGTFDLLGSGPVDMRRGQRGNGARIDWRRDPISGQRYARVFSQWRWRPDRMQPGSADVKGPWEIGRCQHFPTLGLAWWLTGDERYARCFARTVSDFRRRNPVGVGVQWACPMDVALRLVSWLQGVSYFQGARPLTFLWWRGFLKSLVEHGRFIAQNLEYGTFNGQIITSNHHLSNLLGLYWLATSFPHLDAACVWRGIAERGLEQEIHRQVLPDGGNYETSVPYHRLDLEMFLSAYAMSHTFGQPLSREYRQRLIDGLRWLAALRQPNGRMPQIGDADNGRAHILTGFGRWNQESMDHLLAAGACVLDCPELSAEIPLANQAEAVLWGHEPHSVQSSMKQHSATLLAESGLAVARRGSTYALLSNGPVGTSGVGNHKHNDQLAIEWVVGTQPLIVDGGSYIYTADPAARNQFRSVITHNTVSVDEQEQHTLRPDWLFRLMQEGDASLDVVQGTDGAVGITGSHTCYRRLESPLIHTRKLWMGPDGTLVIDDYFDHPHGHQLRWYMLLYPGVTAHIAGSQIRLDGPHGSGILRSDADQRWSLETAWYSPGYGVRQQTQALVAKRGDDPQRVTTALIPAGCNAITHDEAQRLADQFWHGQRVPQPVAA